MRVVIEEYDDATDISDVGSTLREVVLYGNRVSLYIKVLLYTVIKIVLMKQGFI